MPLHVCRRVTPHGAAAVSWILGLVWLLRNRSMFQSLSLFGTRNTVWFPSLQTVLRRIVLRHFRSPVLLAPHFLTDAANSWNILKTSCVNIVSWSPQSWKTRCVLPR